MEALKPSITEQDHTAAASTATAPYILVDTDAALIVDGDARALAHIGCNPGRRLPLALDSAMPALSVLRRFEAEPARDDVVARDLLFWTPRGTVVVPTRLTRSGNGRAVVRVTFTSVFGDDATAQPQRAAIAETVSDAAMTSAAETEPPRQQRDDAETLREIARRIREGQRVAIDTPRESVALAAPVHAAIATDIAAEDVSAAHTAATVGDVPADDTALRDAAMTPPDAARHGAIAPEAPPVTAPLPTALPPREREASVAPQDLSKLAHELKTPLTAIVAAAEIMRDERLGAMGNAKYLEYARDVHESATHALAVITSMLGGANGRIAELPVTMDLVALAAATISTLQPLAVERQITLALDSPDDQMQVTARPTAMRQILINLITNALKFTPPGGDIRVVTGYMPRGNAYFGVRDTGGGMSVETLSSIFNDGDRDRRYPRKVRAGGGLGMGLPLVRRLATENGAEIEIDSAPGKGTVVLVCFTGV
ncbi:MAG: sensor histidine kinase [Hyphomicrobium sp.]